MVIFHSYVKLPEGNYCTNVGCISGKHVKMLVCSEQLPKNSTKFGMTITNTKFFCDGLKPPTSFDIHESTIQLSICCFYVLICWAKKYIHYIIKHIC